MIDTLGQRLKELRGQMSQTAAAKGIGTDQQTLSRYEKCERNPDAEMLLRIAEYYGVSCDYLLGISDVPSTDCTIQSVHAVTGLTESAIQQLSEYNKSNRATWNMDIINLILESKDFAEMLKIISSMLTHEAKPFYQDVFGTDSHDIGRFTADRHFQSILNAIIEKYANDSISDNRIAYYRAYMSEHAGQITPEQLEKTIKEYDRGNFEYNPLKEG